MKRFILLSLVFFALGLTACGGGSDSGNRSSGGSGTTTTSGAVSGSGS